MASEGRNRKHFEVHRQTVRWNFDIYRCKSTKERKRTATASIVLTYVPVKTHRQKEWTASVKKQRKLPEKVTFLYFFYAANQSKSLYNMVLQNSYYFTSKIEIKPQPWNSREKATKNYFTSKIEIKPQHAAAIYANMSDYFTSKIEIKPQLLARIINSAKNYFTSKIEIKPQLQSSCTPLYRYYFTSKIEIKPQPKLFTPSSRTDYFTSKIEIKPQPHCLFSSQRFYYFTSKIEIKPQRNLRYPVDFRIILHQR